MALASCSTSVLRNALEIYSHPAYETVRVRLPGLATARAATVRQRPAPLGGPETVAVALRGLPAGIYAVRVLSAGAEYTGRVVVRWLPPGTEHKKSPASWSGIFYFGSSTATGGYASTSAYSVWWRFTKPAMKVQVIFTFNFCSRA